jgi:hypothetical protein
MQVERPHTNRAVRFAQIDEVSAQLVWGSGERVSNTWITYRRDRDNLAKAGLIPDSPYEI